VTVDMTIRRVPWFPVGLLLLVLLGAWMPLRPALAEEAPVNQWLERLAPALNMTSYRGVFVYARGDQVHSMRIAHRYHDGMVEERLVLQDGGSGEIVRRGADVVCVLPDQGRIRLDQVIPSGPFAEAFTRQLMPVNRWYRAKLVGEDRVAGYDTVKIVLEARDAHRYSHKLWLEQSTGLLVKSSVQDASGKVMEHFQFTSLEITDDISDDEFQVKTTGREIARTLSGAAPVPAHTPASRMNGWELGWRPDGFMPAAAPRSGRLRAVAFSDGLAAFSVFVEPLGRLKMPMGVSRIGATTVFTHELDVAGQPFLVTVVGEVPPVTARKVAESVRVDAAQVFGDRRP